MSIPNTVRFNASGLLFLRPFVEEPMAQVRQYRSVFGLTLLNGFLSVLFLASILVSDRYMTQALLGASVAVTALLGGLEWNRGIRNRALNNLATSIVLVVIMLLQSTGG